MYAIRSYYDRPERQQCLATHLRIVAGDDAEQNADRVAAADLGQGANRLAADADIPMVQGPFQGIGGFVAADLTEDGDGIADHEPALIFHVLDQDRQGRGPLADKHFGQRFAHLAVALFGESYNFV